ncbi:hypothetical protein EIP86_007238 [Pleurotus ostreatoroseus]|nr:hypothetical protein EIP86_007238 [Pleurotus ostreatoroseus]
MDSKAISAPQITRVGSYTLRCANPASLASLGSSVRLGALDQFVAPFIPVVLVYTYNEPSSTVETQSELLPVDRLRRAAELLLDYYPCLTGRLHIDPKNGIRSLDRLGSGAELVMAQCNARLDEYCQSPHDGTAAPEALTAPFDPALDAVFQNPVFTIQHTRFACGGVALGMRILHTLCDAEGFFLVVRHLAELYRAVRVSETASGGLIGSGSGVLAQTPCTQFYLSELPESMTPEERQEALAFRPSLYHLKPDSDASTTVPAAGSDVPIPPAVEPTPPPVVGRVMRFSGAELDALKALATPPTGKGWISTFDALTAHIYQRLYLARLQLQRIHPELSPPEVSRGILISVNCRPATLLDLPPRYPANALLTPFTSLSHELLADGPLWAIARNVHDLVRIDADEAKRTACWLGAQPDKNRVEFEFGWPRGSFLVSQWNKFDMYEGALFDVDARGEAIRPTLASPPFTSISTVDGLVYYVATEEQSSSATSTINNASIDVYLTLSEPLWPILDQDKDFRRFRSVD